MAIRIQDDFTGPEVEVRVLDGGGAGVQLGSTETQERVYGLTSRPWSSTRSTRKLVAAFSGKVVRKDLLQQIKGGENVPSYVLEYLLGRYCASDDEAEIQAWYRGRQGHATTHYFRQDEPKGAKALVELNWAARFIDRVEVRFVPSEAKYWASMDNFGYRASISPTTSIAVRTAVRGWHLALVDVEFRIDAEKNGSPFHITELKPIQLARFDLDKNAREDATSLRMSGLMSC